VFFAFGSFTSTPELSIGVTTMKMMSSTSTTSTNGVTLMSPMSPPFLPPTFIAMVGPRYAPFRCSAGHSCFSHQSTNSCIDIVMSLVIWSIRYVK